MTRQRTEEPAPLPGSAPSLPQPPRGRRLRARDALVVIGLASMLLLVSQGSSVRHAGEEMQPGVERSLLLAVGKPTGWVADRLPLEDWTDDALGFLGDDSANGPGGFDRPARLVGNGRVPPVSPESFDPAQLGAKAPQPHPLGTLLVTGDSLSQPLDTTLARRLSGEHGVKVERDPHIGTGISKSGLVDWGKLSTKQARERKPSAVVVFIGANEGFPMPGPGGKSIECCGPDWAAEYAYRVRRMMNTYRQGGAARVYWLTLPMPRDGDRQEIARAVNAAIEIAADPYRAQVRVLDMVDVFTPGGHYRDAMTVGGRSQIVREPDGIHLNDVGAGVAADSVLAAIRRDFGK